MANNKHITLIDIRHDTLFNNTTNGAKHDYKHLKNAMNFYAERGVNEFEKQFPDKQQQYVLVSQNGADGLEFADELTKKGYTIHWLISGMFRWEWYVNNVQLFGCMDYFVN
jgi:rhodanese-related sulfurtransferase